MFPLLGLVMALALLGGVFSIDLGLLYDGREQARIAADLSALAAVQELPLDENEARLKGFEYAALNGFDDCNPPGGDVGPPGCDAAITVSVTIDTDPGGNAIACTRPGHCVQVVVEQEWDWLLGGLLHLPPVRITASAISQSGAEPRDVMVVLDRSGSMCFDVDGGPGGGGGSGASCEEASKATLVGQDMTASGSLNLTIPVGLHPNLNVPFAGTNPSRFTINGVPITYVPAVHSLNAIKGLIDGSAAGVIATFSTGSDAKLTLTGENLGGPASINVDDVTGNFFYATRMLDASLIPTRLVGRDVGTMISYPADLNVPLSDLNSMAANFDVDFLLVPGGSTFCINGVTGVEPCAAAFDIPYHTGETLTAILNRITGAGVGVTATFASDVLTLRRNVNGPVPISIADRPGGNFLQAMKLLQVPTSTTAIGGDIADCTGPGNEASCFDGSDLPVPISQLNDELQVDLVPVPTSPGPGSGVFVINGTNIPYNSTESLTTILANITASTANVTATVQTDSDTLVLTQKTPGNQPITFRDVDTTNGVGNFLQGMRFISPIRRSTVEGLNVEGTLGSNFDTSDDLGVQLDALDDELEIDFTPGPGVLCIRVTSGPCNDTPGNGAKIAYTAAASGGSTLNSILADINNPANGTGVIASITADRLLLRRNMYGAGPITLADLSGNFFGAMRLLGGTKTIVVGEIVGNLSGASPNHLNANLNTLNAQMTVDFAPVPNGSFEINGIPFTYNAMNDTINEVMTAINASADADVTASFNTTTDKFMLTRDTIGPLNITYSDLSGNWFQAMQFLTGGTATTAVGEVVGALVPGDLNLNVNNGGLALKTSPDFQNVTNGRIRINGTEIAYNAGNDTLNEIMAAINTSNAAVTATFDVNTDRLTLTRNAPGSATIDYADVTGNFFHVMHFVSGGGLTTAVGLDVSTCSGGGCQPFDSAALAADLDTLNGEMDVDFQLTNPSTFTINGVQISYNPNNDSLNDIKGFIDGSAAGVTATYNTTADTLTLTNNAPGDVTITFSDNTGNFFRAMRFLEGSRTVAVGQDVATCQNCDITDNERGSNLTGSTPNDDMTRDFVGVPNGSFLINGAPITYDADVDTINTIMGKIDASVGADVTATFDNSTDRLTLTRDSFGDLPIDMSDVVGNFLWAMQMVAPATRTTVVGENVDAGGNQVSDSDYAGANLNELNDELSVDFLPVTNGSLTINGAEILYNAQTDELDDLVAYINASADADVTASFDTGTQQFTLTRDTVGAGFDIVYNDNVGNFFAAMHLLSPGTRTTAVGQDAGDFDSTGDVDDGLDNLTGEMTVDLVPVSNGSFTINGAPIPYDSSNNTNDSLNIVIGRINASAQADVTATFVDGGNPRLTFTRDSYGPQTIEMQDVTGNFLAAFRMMQSATYSTRAGGDVGTSFDTGDLGLTLAQVNNNANVVMDIDFVLTNPMQFSINGTPIPSFDPNTTSLNTIKGLIDASGGDVTATFDVTDGVDNMTLTRDSAGLQTITVADTTGNFMQAMKLYQPGTPQILVSQNVSNCAGCAPFDDVDLTDLLTNLNDELNIDVQAVSATQFSINSVPIGPFDPATTTLSGVKTLIDGSGAGVTATYSTTNDTLTLTRTTMGPQVITLADNNGNFLKAMRLLDPGTFSARAGSDIGGGFDPDDLAPPRTVAQLNANVTMDIPFVIVNPMRFSINGAEISFDPNNTSLNGVKALIDASTGADVTAAYNTDSGVDNLTLTRDNPGPLTITAADISGNFMAAMKLVTPGTPASVTGLEVDTSDGGGCGSNCFESNDSDNALRDLNSSNAQFVVPFSLSNDPRSFTITAGGVTRTVTYCPRAASGNGTGVCNGVTSTLDSILSDINASGAVVTASIDYGSDTLTLTRTVAGPGSIALVDVTGNFLQAMRLLDAGTPASITGLELDICDTSVTTPCGGSTGNEYRFETSGGNSDLGRQLRDLNGGQAQWVVPFATADNNLRNFRINGVNISYCPRANNNSGGCTGSTLASVQAAINASAAGVQATYNEATDTMTLTRTVPGANPITLADVANGGTPAGNFLLAMRLINAGGSIIGSVTDGTNGDGSIIGDVTPGTAGGAVIGTFTNGTNGNGSIIGNQTNGVASALLGTFTNGIPAATLATITLGTPGGGPLGTKTMGGPGALIATVTLGAAATTLATVSVGLGVDEVAAITLGTDANHVVEPQLGTGAMVGQFTVGFVPPVVQNVIAVVTPGLDSSDLLGELQLGDDPDIGHLIATFTLSNHRPLDNPAVHFWEPFGPVQRAAGLFSRMELFQPGIDQMGLASFGTTAALDLGLDDMADGVVGDQFGVAGSDFERKLLGLVPEGQTNIGGGLCMALNELRFPASAGGSAPFGHGQLGADQIIVLLSDGEPNQTGGAGCPVVGATAAAGCTDWGSNVPNGSDEYSLYLSCLAELAGVIIHTIGLGDGVNEDLMREMAAITGGQYFDADTSADLDAQFEEIASILGISLTR